MKRSLEEGDPLHEMASSKERLPNGGPEPMKKASDWASLIEAVLDQDAAGNSAAILYESDAATECELRPELRRVRLTTHGENA